MTEIVPAAAFVRHLRARRDHALARPKHVNPKKAFADAKEIWLSVRNHWLAGWDRRKDSRVALERAADAMFESGELPSEPNIELLSVAEALLHRRATLMVPIAARFGPTIALRVKVSSEGWVIASGREQNVWWWMLNEVKASPSRLVDLGWQAMRIIACRADARAYAEVRDAALALREAETEPVRRAPLDFVFPNEPAWAAADALEIASKSPVAKHAHEIAPMFASLADEAAATTLLTALAPSQAVPTLAYACDLVVALGADAATRVLAVQAASTLAARSSVDTEVQKLACAMTSIKSEAMADVLAPLVRHPRFGRHIVWYFEAYGDLARRALASSARGKSIAADAARSLIEGHARAAEADSGSIDDAPEILRNPPWRARDPDLELALDPIPFDETIAWAEGERERIASAPAVANTQAEVRDITKEELALFDALPQAQKYVDVWPRWINKKWLVLDLPDDRRLALWNARARLYYRPPEFMLARFGKDALDGLYPRDALELDDDRMFSACLRVDSPRTALVCARVIARRRPWGKRAKAWLLEHAEAAAVGLIPAAFKQPSRAKRLARRALRFVATHRESIVRDVAARHGRDGERAVIDFAFCDPLARIDVRATPPSWIDIAALPRLRTRSGRVLPREATARLVDILRSRGTDVPYAGIATLRETLDARSLADIAWSLFYTWVRHGKRRMHEWMALALAAFPTDDTVTRLAPHARDWTHADPHACISLVDVLAAIGSDEAKLVLGTMAEDARSDMLRLALTEALGAPSDAPVDLGLDARGEGLLDLGGRTVRVVLDESFTPRIVLEGGRRVAQVPRASKTDDPALVREATARFNRLRAAAKSIVRTELRKLERAMLESTEITVSDLEARFARHPLLVHAARRLVWGMRDGETLTTFRVVEDGTYADVGDLPLALEPASRISVVHPLDIDADLRARWGTLFADYELLQPFEQLGRFIYTGSASEAVTMLKKLAGVMVPARSLLHTLALHRWERPAGRRIATSWRELRASKKGVRAFVTFSPGIALDAIRKAPDQKLNAMTVPQSPDLAALDRMELSELVRTVVMLRS